MKSLLKEQLRALLENNSRYSTKRDYYRTLFIVAKVHQLYADDPYFQNSNAGQWIGNAICDIHGNIKVTTNTAVAGDVRANDKTGIVRENPMYLTITLKAGRGIEHPDTYSPNTEPARTRKERFSMPDGTDDYVSIPVPNSPASDAQIKAYLIYGKEIIDFVEKNMKDRVGYLDGKGEKLAQNTADKDQYKFDKYKKEQQAKANKLKMGQTRMQEPSKTEPLTSMGKQASDYEARKAAARAAKNQQQ